MTPSNQIRIASLCHLALLFAASTLLAGCALGGFTSPGAAPEAGAAISGVAHGGQQPISGAHIYLFQAGIGTGTYNAAPASLLTASSGTSANPAVADADGHYYVPTVASGAFSISGHYACSAADSNGIQPQVYLLGVGGDPQIGTGNNNQYITLATAFGDCNLLSTSSVINVNEITTAATASALQQFANFATGFTAVPIGFSTSATNTRGLKMAMATANLLYDINTASARTTTPTTSVGTGTAPSKLLTEFGNVLAYCVNSNPAQDTSCSTLSTQATGSNSPIANTLADAIGMAQNPTRNVASLWGDIPAASAFGAQLGAAPNDWSLAIAYTAPSLYQPTSIAIDSVGDVWANNTFVSGTSTNVLNEFDNTGNVLSGSAGFTGTSLNKATNLAIDNTGYVWTTSNANNALYKFTAAGAYVTHYTGGGMSSPNGITIDAGNNVWVSGFLGSSIANTLSEFVQGTTNAFTQTTTLASSSSTYGVRSLVFDPSGYLWTANSLTGTVGQTGFTTTVLDSTGALVAGPLNTYSSSSTNAQNPYFVASDAQGYTWFACASGAVAEFSPARVLLSNNGYRNSNFVTTRGIAVDGDGNVWVANYSGGATVNTTTGLYTTTSNVAKLAGSQATTPGAILSGTTGLKSDQQSLDKPAMVAIDSAGNLWLPQIGTTVHAGGSIVEFVGSAAPVVTPLAVALSQGKLGTRP